MHLRFSTCIGTSVVDRNTGEPIGSLSGIFLNPDTGKVEGIYVYIPGFLRGQHCFASSSDIVHWGMAIQVNTVDAVGPIEDRIRLALILAERRTVLGQRIRTESGRRLGVCRDVQFDTESLKLEWIFPRRFLRWGIALPSTEIRVIRKDAIIVRDPSSALAQVASAENESLSYEAFPEIAEARRI